MGHLSSSAGACINTLQISNESWNVLKNPNNQAKLYQNSYCSSFFLLHFLKTFIRSYLLYTPFLVLLFGFQPTLHMKYYLSMIIIQLSLFHHSTCGQWICACLRKNGKIQNVLKHLCLSNLAAVLCTHNAYSSGGAGLGFSMTGKLGCAWIGAWEVHGVWWCSDVGDVIVFKDRTNKVQQFWMWVPLPAHVEKYTKHAFLGARSS